MIDLGAMLSQGASFANGINANGDIVGTVKIKGHEAPHTFIYRNGRMQLRFGPDSLYVTRDITDDGNVIGSTYTGHVLKSGTVSADRLARRLGWDGWLTLVTMAGLIVYAGFRARARIRKGLDFKLMFLSVA